MRLLLLTILCFPLVAFAQGLSDFSVAYSPIGIMYELQYHERNIDDDIGDPTVVSRPKKEEPATVKVHPNPSSSDLYVTLTGNGEKGKVVLYDILGNVLVEGKTFKLTGGATTWSHNVSAWHSGTYVVRVLQDGLVVKSLRFIKN